MTVTVSFDHAAGDLDVELVAADGRVLGSSTSVQNVETVRGNGTVFVRVYGYRGAANSYTIVAR